MEPRTITKNRIKEYLRTHLNPGACDPATLDWADEIVDNVIDTAKQELMAEKEQQFYKTWNRRFDDNPATKAGKRAEPSQADLSQVDGELLNMIFKGIEVG